MAMSVIDMFELEDGVLSGGAQAFTRCTGKKLRTSDVAGQAECGALECAHCAEALGA